MGPRPLLAYISQPTGFGGIPLLSCKLGYLLRFELRLARCLVVENVYSQALPLPPLNDTLLLLAVARNISWLRSRPMWLEQILCVGYLG